MYYNFPVAYLLRTLLLIMGLVIWAMVASAEGFLPLPFDHIKLAMATFIFTIFVQALVMFYSIGVSRLQEQVFTALKTSKDWSELFSNPPPDKAPYQKKVYQLFLACQRGKRQIIPWTMLMLTLGSVAFLLGGAYHTGVVSKTIHQGVAYGFTMALTIGLVRQWYFLGQINQSLHKLKLLFQIPFTEM